MATFKKSTAEHVQHMFRYRWQATQLGDKPTMLQKPGHIAVAMDFGENHTILEPVEVQAMHWTKEQIANLVFVVYSVVPRTHSGSSPTTPDSAQGSGMHSSSAGACSATSAPADRQTVVMEQYFFISKVLKKGCEFVNTYILKLLDHLEEQGRTVDVIHFISDGCAGDFKSNHSMLDRAMLWMMTTTDGKKVTCIVNFSESGHGKGPWDGAVAWLKHTLHMDAINNGVVWRSLDEIANHINTNYSTASENYNRNRLLIRRHCFVVNEEDIDYSLTSRAKADIRGIMSMHQFDCPGGSIRGVNDLQVGYRHLSCYCAKCMDRDFEHCVNKHIVGPMRRVQLRPDNEATALVIEGYREQSELVDMWENEINYGSIVVPATGDFPTLQDPVGCWVALKHDDVEYSDYLYYVMWVNKGPTLLKSAKRDGYGSHFSRGTTVCEGLYLELYTDSDGHLLPESEGRYTLSPGHAVCDIKSVVYSGFSVDIIPQGNQVVYQIDDTTQREIRDRVNSVLI